MRAGLVKFVNRETYKMLVTVNCFSWSFLRWIELIILLTVWCDLPLHSGLLPFHVPSEHVMVVSPLSSKPARHLKFADLPCSKLSPTLPPLCGLPGSEHGAKRLKESKHCILQ